jgi:adenine phosphoribosyltransferase
LESTRTSPRRYLLSAKCQVERTDKQGITFMDIFPLLQDPIAFETLITHLMHHILTTHKTKPDVIVGLDARGFLLGPIIAMRLGASFVPVRKGGKLPGDCEKVEYKLEYGSDVFEMQKGAIKEGQSVIVIE